MEVNLNWLLLRSLASASNVGMLFYNPDNLLERYNAPDTLKCQHTFHLTAGHCLYSDMGRILCSIEEDTFGGHETVCGVSRAEQVAEQFGALSYQQAHNRRHQNGYDSFLVELAKYGLNKRDLAANVNFFAQLAIDEEGGFALKEPDAGQSSVVLRFAMDTLVILHTCPHPLSTLTAYPETELAVEVLSAGQAVPDICLGKAENQRGLANNALYALSTVEAFNQGVE